MSGNRNSGRKKLPTEVKKAQGTLEKHRQIENELVLPPDTAPVAPSGLGEIGLQVWDSVYNELSELGVLAKVDRNHIAMYCRYMEIFQIANEQMKNDFTIEQTSGNGNTRIEVSKLFTVMNQAAAFVLKFASEYGLTASSRQSIQTVKKGDDDDISQYLT